MAIPDKRMTEDEVVGELRSGMTIGIGGWGSRRKPMSLVRAILRSDLTDLTIVAYGGPDVGLLCAAGKVNKVVSGFVSLDSIPLEPHYRAARQAGSIEVNEYDEGMLMLSLMAAAWRVPFLPTRAGLGSDVLTNQPFLKTVTSPYPGPDGADPEELVAMPAAELDAALIHMNRADRGGNAQFLGPDLYMDDWMALAAPRTFVSTERVIATEDFRAHGSIHTQRISRLNVSGVVEAPGGAHFTECPPDYGRDETFQREYVKAAADPDAWAVFRKEWLELETEAEYQAAVASRRAQKEGTSR